MKKIIMCMLALTLIMQLGTVSCVSAYASNSSSGKAMCVIECNDGAILYSKNMDEKMAMASTTKIVTAITVLDNCDDLNEIIVVADNAVGVTGTSIYLQKGEEISVIDLLYGLMLRSGNDAATALAYHIAGSVEDFAILMEETAAQVGAINSSFANPHGLDEAEHYTTAYDLAIITRYALENETFREIVATKNYVIDSTNVSSKRFLTNKNKLLTQLDGCIGVKTGFTNNAGRCLVSAVERDNLRTVCVVFNCGPMFEDSTRLLNQSQTDFSAINVLPKNTPLASEMLYDKDGNSYFIFSPIDIFVTVNDSNLDNLHYEYKINEQEYVNNGEIIGNVQIFNEKGLIKTAKLYTIEVQELLKEKDMPREIIDGWAGMENENQ